jgi:hypothetical protein
MDCPICVVTYVVTFAVCCLASCACVSVVMPTNPATMKFPVHTTSCSRFAQHSVLITMIKPPQGYGSHCALCFLVPPPLPLPVLALVLPLRLVAVADALFGMVNINIYYKTHTASQGNQRNNPMSQQVFLSRNRSGQAQWKRTNRATQTGHIRQKISPGVQHRSTQGQHKLGYKDVCGHIQPRTEMRPTRPSEPADTAAIQQEVAPAQPYAKLSQGARYKGRPRNPSRPRGLIPQAVEKRHCWLAEAPIALH